MTWTLEIGQNLALILWTAMVAYLVNRWWAYSTLRNRKP